jgi:hypothetical protein
VVELELQTLIGWAWATECKALNKKNGEVVADHFTFECMHDPRNVRLWTKRKAVADHFTFEVAAVRHTPTTVEGVKEMLREQRKSQHG